MNINFGLFPPLTQAPPTRDAAGNRLKGPQKTVARKNELARRALADMERWIAGDIAVAAAE
jgi:methylenetetrahydrofolate--tRNA-(uracil-5-)-methyltransferase